VAVALLSARAFRLKIFRGSFVCASSRRIAYAGGLPVSDYRDATVRTEETRKSCAKG
jgi:hypothetical protein